MSVNNFLRNKLKNVIYRKEYREIFVDNADLLDYTEKKVKEWHTHDTWKNHRKHQWKGDKK